MGNPSEFDESSYNLELWKQRFPLDEYLEALSRRQSDFLFIPGKNGPMQLALREQMAERLGPRLVERPAVLSDVFLFYLGEATHRDSTKIGGLPYRPADVPWPIDPVDGKPYTFLGQLRVRESRDLIGIEPPGDVLLVFLKGLWPEIEHDAPPILEWYRLGVRNLVEADAIPEPGFKCFTGGGVRYRIREYPDAYDLFREFGDRAFFGAVWAGWKIGGEPRWFEPPQVDLTGLEFLGTMSSILPETTLSFPFLNMEHPVDWPYPPGMEALGIQGMESLHFFTDQAGKTLSISK